MIKKIFCLLLLVAISGFSYSQQAIEFYVKGLSKAKLKDYRGAIADYDKALEISPVGYLRPYFSRGIAKEILKDYWGAIADYSKIIEEEQSLWYPSIDEAKDLLEDNIGILVYCHFSQQNIYPERLKIIAYLKRARAKAELKDYTGAMADYSKIIAISPSYDAAVGYLNRARAKADLKDYRGAIEDYDKAIEIIKDCTIAYLNRGLAKFKLGRKDSGCLDLSKAGELGAENAYDMIQKYCN